MSLKVSLLAGGAPVQSSNILYQLFGVYTPGQPGHVRQMLQQAGWLATAVYIGHYGITALSIASVVYLVRNGGWNQLHLVMFTGLSGFGLGTGLITAAGSIDAAPEKLRGHFFYGFFHLAGGMLDLVSSAMLWAKAAKANRKGLDTKTDIGLAIALTVVCSAFHLIIAFESLRDFYNSGGRLRWAGRQQHLIYVGLRFVTAASSFCILMITGYLFCTGKGDNISCPVQKYPYVWLYLLAAGSVAFMGIGSVAIQVEPNMISEMQFSFAFTAANIMAGVGMLYIAGPALKNNWPKGSTDKDKMAQSILALSTISGCGHLLYFLAPLYRPPIGGGGGYY